MVSAQHDMHADVVGCLCSVGDRDGLTHLGQATHSSVESLRITQIHTEPITMSVNKNLEWKKALMLSLLPALPPQGASELALDMAWGIIASGC